MLRTLVPSINVESSTQLTGQSNTIVNYLLRVIGKYINIYMQLGIEIVVIWVLF